MYFIIINLVLTVNCKTIPMASRNWSYIEPVVGPCKESSCRLLNACNFFFKILKQMVKIRSVKCKDFSLLVPSGLQIKTATTSKEAA